MTPAPELDVDPVRHHAPVVLVVAHPDDEIEWPGAQLAARPERLLCVHATGGAHPAPAAPSLVQLPFDDQSLPNRLPELTVVLEGLLHAVQPSAVVTHPYEGGQPDHDAVSIAVAAVVARWPREALGPPPRRIELACHHEAEAGRS